MNISDKGNWSLIHWAVTDIIPGDRGTMSSRNLTDEEYLLITMGPKRKDMLSVVCLLVIYSFIFVTGIVGNVCTAIVIVRNRHMQTTTDYYLCSLAISDILILVSCLPFEAYSIWQAYPFNFGEVCCIGKALLTEMTSYASVLTITAFTVERYIAICHPLMSHKIADLRRSVMIIIGIWTISFVIALPYPIHTRTLFYAHSPSTKKPLQESLVCNIPSQWISEMTIMFQISTFLFFIVPMTAIIILYVLIAITLRSTALNRANSEESTGGHHSSHSRRVVRMLVAVVAAFFFCWAPFHTQRLYTIYHRELWTPYELEVQSHLFYISGVLYFVGSTVNPFLYNVMSKRYREAFKETLCCCVGHRKSKYQRSLVYYYNNMKSTIRSNVSREEGDKQGEPTSLNNRNSLTRNPKTDSNYPLKTKLLSNSAKAHGSQQSGNKMLRDGTNVDNEYHSDNEDLKLLTYLPLNKAENMEMMEQTKSNIYTQRS
ncbi:pyrokinin-1 receptor-like [Saccostrea echinata]|uniref:pyrokinin-1 receptor-like n=1 Tax=Saccostrea echinata TaxID=191078 RepID=UPI002A800523|nr:pyrokinin-1 receptor-like [Saccostrea echinata]XP_061177085.1 pyrokinin-1 receptor-like [Saccostrea echinata]